MRALNSSVVLDATSGIVLGKNEFFKASLSIYTAAHSREDYVQVRASKKSWIEES